MLYLEDFLELMENLPAELRDRFTEIRELDLQVQNGLDQNEARVRGLYRAAGSMSREERQSHFNDIKEGYLKVIEDSDEKVNLATTVHDLLKRYLAKLDVEISKFKMELEADKPGITEMLEQSLKGGYPASNAGQFKSERRRRRGGAVGRPGSVVNGGTSAWTNGHVGTSGPVVINGYGREPVAAPVHHAAVGEYGRGGYSNYIRKSQSYPNRMMEMRPSGPQQSIMTSSQLPQQHHQQLLQQQQQAAVAAAAAAQQQQQSLPLVQQQLMQPRPQPPQPSQLAPTVRERTGTGSTSSGFLSSFTDQPESRHGRPRKLTSRVQEMLKEASHRHERLSSHESTASTSQTHGAQSDEEIEEGSESEMTDATDQNDQQRWCICNQVSYGEMVACDNKDCPFEWFHYQCVGITAPPKGKWFCPHCTAVMKRRHSKNLNM